MNPASPEKITIHIATVHWLSDRWVSIQERHFRQHLPAGYRVYAWLNDVPNVSKELFYYTCTEPIKSHPVKLNRLGDLICRSAESDDEVIIFIDGDAFPIASLDHLIREVLPAKKLIAVQRRENNGDIQPHPCFCLTTVGFWRTLKGDWEGGYKWRDNNGRRVSDIGGNLLQQLNEKKIDWHPLLRSNKKDLHPLFFAVYADLVYHHGGGFRSKKSRQDKAMLRAKILRDKPLARFIPGYVRSRVKLLLNDVGAANHEVSEAVFKKIEASPDFYKEFI